MIKKTKRQVNVASLARSHTESCIRILHNLAKSRKTPAASRIAAIQTLLDRGYGKPLQAIAAEISDKTGEPLSEIEAKRRFPYAMALLQRSLANETPDIVDITPEEEDD